MNLLSSAERHLWKDYRLALARGDHNSAYSTALKAVEVYDSADSQKIRALWRRNVCLTLYYQGDHEGAIRAALEAVRDEVEPYGRSLALITLAGLYTANAQYSAAAFELGKAEEISSHLPSDVYLSTGLHDCKGVVSVSTGDYNQALVEYEKGLRALSQSRGSLWRAATLSNNIGHALAYLGRFEEAEDWLAEAFQIDNDCPHLFNKGGFFQTLGYVYLKTNRLNEAEGLLRKSAYILKRFSQPRLLTSTMLYLSETQERMRKYAEARRHAERALTLATRIKSESLCTEAKERLASIRPPVSTSTQHRMAVNHIVCVSDLMRSALRRVEAVAHTDEVVLVLGETGTGKELVAAAIHRESNRARGPFVPFNCSALSRDMIESRLFGHRKGSFTGASQDQLGVIRAAQGGSLFLDEIGDLTLEAQGALLRFLQSGEIQPVGANTPTKVDVRVIAATNRNLAQEADAGRFRKDLYYRLNGVTLTLPPLRFRPEDIGPLARHFAAEVSKEYGVLEPVFTKSEIKQLSRYSWPGNVRELQSYIKCLALFGPQQLPLLEQDMNATRQYWNRLTDVQKDVELVNALKRTDGNVTAAARLLGISRRTIQLRRRRQL